MQLLTLKLQQKKLAPILTLIRPLSRPSFRLRLISLQRVAYASKKELRWARRWPPKKLKNAVSSPKSTQKLFLLVFLAASIFSHQLIIGAHWTLKREMCLYNSWLLLIWNKNMWPHLKLLRDCSREPAVSATSTSCCSHLLNYRCPWTATTAAIQERLPPNWTLIKLALQEQSQAQPPSYKQKWMVTNWQAAQLQVNQQLLTCQLHQWKKL